jgi:class 3 adenylate cyclase
VSTLRAGLQGKIDVEPLGYRLITVVMVDMVASTETARRKGPEAMRRRLSILRAVVEEETRRFDGRVLQHVGDGSVLHFGWPLSREGDAERAASGEVNRGMELVAAAVTAAAAVGAVPLEARACRTLRALATKSGDSLALSGAREGRSHERRQNRALRSRMGKA